MTVEQSKFRLAADPVELEAVEALLERFPDIDDAATRRVAAFLRDASSLDIGLLSSNKQAWTAQEQLRRSRPDLFRTSARGWAVGIVVAVVTVLMLAWLATFADA